MSADHAGLDLFEIRFISGGHVGARQLWAPDGEAAREHLEQNASLYGLPAERVYVLSTGQVTVQEQRVG